MYMVELPSCGYIYIEINILYVNRGIGVYIYTPEELSIYIHDSYVCIHHMYAYIIRVK